MSNSALNKRIELGSRNVQVANPKAEQQNRVQSFVECNTNKFTIYFSTLIVASIALFVFLFAPTWSFAQTEETQYEKLSRQFVKSLELFKDENNISNLNEGFKQVKIIAEQGLPAAQHWVGVCYSYGLGTIKDPVKQVEWYKKAAEQGDISGLYRVGLCYLTGDGVIQDLQKGCQYIRSAAESDAPDGEGADSIKLRAITIYNKYCH